MKEYKRVKAIDDYEELTIWIIAKMKFLKTALNSLKYEIYN